MKKPIVKIEIYSIDVCNSRIKHWTEEIEKQQEKGADTKINQSLLNFWINYKRKIYGS